MAFLRCFFHITRELPRKKRDSSKCLIIFQFGSVDSVKYTEYGREVYV